MALAVLIDADNVSACIADGLFATIGALGRIGLRRMYGDFREARLKPWTVAAARHRIRRRQAPRIGSNASDFALYLDADALLRGRTFDGFCLVSSDGDFAALAAHIRNAGAAAYGFGEAKTPASLRNACTRFFRTEPMRAGAARKFMQPA
ncbi:MAG TPA: NYN domain-containing protein [Rhizomicrobium sp.]|nr:NYN domain-containing protein [Rhizomicrobium sp.]